MADEPTLIVKGGTVVTHEGSRQADLAMAGGTVVGLSDSIEPAGKVIDASGLLVLPGMVDTHVHLMDPGPTDREDFPTGTRAAAAAGTTTIIEHTHAHPIRSAADLAAKREHLRDRANVDFALAAHVWPEDLGTMASTWEAGVAFFKIFTCATHGVPGLTPAEIHAALARIAAVDGRALVHCEDESITAAAERELRKAGRVGPGLLTEWRPREAELVAVATVGVLAAVAGANVTLAHVSTADVAGLVSDLRGRGADLAAEACPQYFALEEDEVAEKGPFRKFTPPARVRSEADRTSMWDAVAAGAFSHFSTDHAPSTVDHKTEGDIWTAPFGLPGLDTTFPFLIDAALSGRITLERLVELTSAVPARRFGLTPQKGSLAAGADADFVLVDPDGHWSVADADVISKAGWSPYAGRRFRGRVEATYLRGRLVAEGRRPLDERMGRFLPGAGSPDRSPLIPKSHR